MISRIQFKVIAFFYVFMYVYGWNVGPAGILTFDVQVHVRLLISIFYICLFIYMYMAT